MEEDAKSYALDGGQEVSDILGGRGGVSTDGEEKVSVVVHKSYQLSFLYISPFHLSIDSKQ